MEEVAYHIFAIMWDVTFSPSDVPFSGLFRVFRTATIRSFAEVLPPETPSMLMRGGVELLDVDTVQ